jgi:hypothetical protein
MDPTQVVRDEHSTMRCRECGFPYDLPPHEVVRRARAAVESVRSAVESVPEDQRGRRPQPDVWSVNGYVAHLADAATTIGERVRAIAETDRPPLPYYDQDRAAVERDYDGQPAEQSLARMSATASDVAGYLATLPPDAWQRTGVHERAGDVRLTEIAHDLPHELEHHAEDIRRIGEQLS